MSTFYRIFSWLILFVPSSFALALEDTESLMDLSLEELMNLEVVTSSKISQEGTRSPVTVRTITQEQIQRMGFRDLKDIFRVLPGFDLSYDVQGEVKTLVLGRGILGNQKLSILLDGKKYSPPTGERFVYGHNMPLSNIKRIEIVYGSASALYGADAFSGVVNLISMDGEELNGAKVDIGYMDTEATVADFTWGKLFSSGLDLVFSARAYQGDDFLFHENYREYDVVNAYGEPLSREPNTYPIENWNVFAKARKGDWSFGFDWQHQLESNAPSTIPTNYAYVEDFVWGQDLGHVWLKHDKNLNDRLHFGTTLSYSHYEVNPDSNFYVIQDVGLSTAAPSYKYALSKSVKVESQGTWSFEKGSLVAGVFFEDIKSFPKTQNLDNPFDTSGPLEDDLTAFQDENGYTFGLLGLTESIFGERNYTNWGGYTQGQWSPRDDMDFTLGLRYDQNSIYGGTVNPRLGYVYRPHTEWTLRASYGTAYIQPSNYYRWENWGNPFAMHIPNEEIKPETVESLSMSALWIKGNHSLQVEVFYNDLKDVIRPVAAPAQADNYPYYNPLRTIVGEDPSTGFVEINVNQGEIQTYGAEIELSIKRDRMLSTVSWTYQDGDDNGLPIAKTSENKIIGNVEYAADRWEAGGTIRYFSSIHTAASNSFFGLGGNGEMSFDGATILYGNFLWKMTNQLKLNLAVDNLLDERYFGASPYGESVWITPRAPQAGRKAWLNLQWRF